MNSNTSKYGNRKVIASIDGINVVFDSKAEYARYRHLQLLQKAKLISGLQLQPKFELAPSFKRNGKTHRATHYIADFIYDRDQKTIVEDVKGDLTDVYKIKKKLFLNKYGEGLTFIEVMYVRNKFIEKEI